jgi:5-methylcytosine-specific restriction protein A
MALADITSREAVLDAVRECDGVGRDAFLAAIGFGRARAYFLDVEGRLDDSKAIAGVAHGYQFPDDAPLRSRDFSGGEATVQRRLEALGFRVRRLPNRPL